MTAWPLLVHAAVVVFLAGAMLGVSHLLGERHSDRATGEPYESGIVASGSARLRLPVQFYVVALLFVIFDLEVVFLVGWAVAVEEVGWAGFAALLGFVGLLVVGLLYEWRQGALDWGISTRAAERARASLEANLRGRR